MAWSILAEPMLVLILLCSGVWLNRRHNTKDVCTDIERCDDRTVKNKTSSGATSSTQASNQVVSASCKVRKINLFFRHVTVFTPDTQIFRNRTTSRILYKFPFLVEVGYWCLIYGTYQVGRAISVAMMNKKTVQVAQEHVLLLIEVERIFGIFVEPSIQTFFLQRPLLLRWVNYTYSFVHIPAAIGFLAWLYFITSKTRRDAQRATSRCCLAHEPGRCRHTSLYEARRRTMALCNLLAFVIFTLWPCMPPRLLNDATGMEGMDARARDYTFIDTVHGSEGASSVWTQNKFCNQYAAIPSLHFGYALLIGLTIAQAPFASGPLPISESPNSASHQRLGLLWMKLIYRIIGLSYIAFILIVIIATANHLVLDAVAGAVVCSLGWRANTVLLNLLPIEDYIYWCLGVHKPLPLGLESDVGVDDR